MRSLNQLSLVELCRECDLGTELVMKFVQEGWILPADAESLFFDQEDLARVYLIRDLIHDFEVNDAAVPIILDLVDQLLSVQAWVQKESGRTPPQV